MPKPLPLTQVQHLITTLNNRVTTAVHACNKELMLRGYTLKFTFTSIDMDVHSVKATVRFDYHRYHKTYKDVSSTSVDDETYTGVSYTIVFTDIASMWVLPEDVKFDIIFNGLRYPLAYHLLTGKSDIVATGMIQSQPLCQDVLFAQATFFINGKHR